MTTAKKKPLKKTPARSQKAVKPAKKLVPAAPRYSELYLRAIKEYERGIAFLQKKSFAEGAAAFESVLKEFPGEAEICDRARHYFAICNEKLHPRSFQPTTAIEHYHLGVFHLNRGETDAAIRQLDKARGLEPGNDMVHYALASAYAVMGERGEAVKALTEAIRLNDKNRVYARNDQDFDRVRNDHEFMILVEPEELRARQ